MRSLDFGSHVSLEMTETRSESPSRVRARNRVASLNEQMTREVTVVAEFDESGVEGFVGRNETTTESEEQLSRPRSEVELRGGRFDACMTAGTLSVSTGDSRSGNESGGGSPDSLPETLSTASARP